MRYLVFILLAGWHIVLSQERFCFEGLVGVNASYVRNHVLSGESPAYGIHIGVGGRLCFKKANKVSVGLYFLHSQKGYQQKQIVKYQPTFYYLSAQVLTFYKFHKTITGYGGIEFSKLQDVNVTRGLETYQPNDVGIVGGIRLFDSNRISINAQAVYGLKPVLNYYLFDQYGNITNSVKDLKNTCYSVGISLKMINR